MAILPSVVFSQKCCEVYLIPLNSEPAIRLDYQILLKLPPLTLVSGSAPVRSFTRPAGGAQKISHQQNRFSTLSTFCGIWHGLSFPVKL